ncbi:hypothetical protein V1498_11810 [Peribacillus sp. SCS-26]|uniref:hypothetical protein n=1 Tax=Paraperibacillus marinus TaxID=3115295 RepID=UPI003905F813
MNLMKKIALSLMSMSLVLPVSAAFAKEGSTSEPIKKQEYNFYVKSNKELSKDELKILRNKMKYKVKNYDGIKVSTTEVEINGVIAEIIMDNSVYEITDEMLQKANLHILEQQELLEKQINTQSVVVLDKGSSNLSVSGPGYVEENPGGGTVVAEFRDPFNKTAQSAFIRTAVISTVGVLASRLSMNMGQRGKEVATAGATTIAATLSAATVPKYAITKLVKSYSDRYKYYMVDQYISAYTDETQDKLLRTSIYYDVKSSASMYGI